MSQPLDLLLRLESLPTDINDLKKAINFTEAEHCPLKTERAARDKPLTVPHASILRQLLHAERSLLQSVCNIYMQDFLCLGYELPSGCEWLPRSAAISPSTMGITPLALEPGGRELKKSHGDSLAGTSEEMASSPGLSGETSGFSLLATSQKHRSARFFSPLRFV